MLKIMHLLQKGYSIKCNVFYNPTSIDVSKLKLKLIEEETKLIEMMRLYEMRLHQVQNQLKNINSSNIDYIFKI